MGPTEAQSFYHVAQYGDPLTRERAMLSLAFSLRCSLYKFHGVRCVVCSFHLWVSPRIAIAAQFLLRQLQ